MTYVNQILSNSILISAILGWVIAQAFKMVLSWDKKFDAKRFFGSGGMPSSHAAFVTALTMGVGFEHGFDGAGFAISAVMAFIVMYDAAGVRRSAGQQAAVLNKITEELKPENMHKQLKELLGHTPIEVIGGAILGIIIAIVRHT